MNITAKACRATASVIALALATPCILQAQEAAPDANPASQGNELLQEVTVTGTRFSGRTSLNSPAPVDIITPEDLRSGGSSELTEALSFEAPAMNFQSNRPANDQAATRLFNFRGLPGSQVLVLVNGKRWHPATNGSGSPAFDFNSIPPTAVGRVDILRDGASAQYGSDAITGVVNLVLKRDTETQLLATFGEYFEGDGPVSEYSLDTGIGIGADGFLHFTGYHRDMGMTNRQGYDNRQYYFAFDPDGNPAVLPTTSALDSTPVLPPGYSFDPREHAPATEALRRSSQVSGNPKRYEFGGNFNFEIPLSGGLDVYGFGGATRRDVDVPAILRRPLENETVRALYPDGVLSTKETDVVDYHAVAGLKGVLGKWDWDVSYGWGLNELERFSTNNNNPSMGAASPRNFYAGKATVSQGAANFDLKRDFDIGLDSPLRMAVGSEYVHQGLEVEAGEPAVYRNGGVPVLDGPNAGRPAPNGAPSIGFYTDLDETDRTRSSIAGYVDFENQLTEKLLLTTAGRFEDHSDFGSTLDGKFSFLFQATDMLGFRGSVSTGFRAPSLVDSYFSSTSSVTFVSNGVLGTRFQRRFAVTDPVVVALGVQPLEPETSGNFSVGVTLQIGDQFSFTADVYRIDVKDGIITSSPFRDAGTLAYLASIGYPDISSVSFATNAIDSQTEGLDVVANYRTEIGNSRLAFTAAANFNDPRVTRVAPTPEQLAAISTTELFDARSIRGFEQGTPHSRLNFSVKYGIGGFNAFVRTVRFGRIGGFFRDPQPQIFPAKWVTDAELSYEVGEFLQFSVGAQNIFDTYPDEALPANNPAGWSPYPQSGNFPFQTNGGYYFARAQFRF